MFSARKVISVTFPCSDGGSVGACFTVQVSLRDSVPVGLSQGQLQNHLGSLCELHTLGSCSGLTDTGRLEGGGSCPFGRSFLGDSVVSWLRTPLRHPPPPRSRPLLDPSSGCGHLVWLGCHILCDWDRSRVITDLGLCRTPSGTHSYLLATSRALLSILTTEHFRLCPMTVPRGSLHISSHVTI